MTLFLRFACALLLGAAGSAHAVKTAEATPVPGNGAVLLTVTVDYPSYLPAGFGFPSIIVETVGGTKSNKLAIAANADGFESTRVYAASLPPGRYRIVTICEDCYLDVEEGSLPDFIVEAGRTRWLGGLVVRVDGMGKRKDPWVQRWGWTLQPDPAPARKLLAALFPELAAAAPLADGGFEVLAGVDAETARDDIRRRAIGVVEPMPHAADGFHFGGLAGVVKRWRPGEPLQLIDTGSPFALRSVVQLEDGRMLVAGEGSTLLYSDDDGRHWRDVSAGLPWGIIPQVARIGSDEVVFTVMKDSSVALYRGRLGGDTWTLVGDYPTEFSFWTGLRGKYAEMSVVGNTLALTLPSKAGVFVDLESGQSHHFEMPGGIAAFSYTADGVMRCRCTRSIATNPWESRDQGRTWVDSPINRWSLLPAFHDAKHAFTFRGAWLEPERSAVFVSEDGTATWKQVKKPSDGFFSAQRWSADGSTMLLAGVELVDKAQVTAAYASRDGGQTWVTMPQQGEWLYAPALPVGD